MSAPTKVNGYSVIKSHYSPGGSGTRDGYVLLVDRGEARDQRYVTAWIGDGDREWWQGHYIEDHESAVRDYNRRCARGY